MSSPEAKRAGWRASAAWNAVLHNASIRALLAIPPTAPPLHSFLLLRALLETSAVSLQARNAFLPAYQGLSPSEAWLGLG